MIVVTGGTGLVGSLLLLRLAEEKQKVRVLLRPGSPPEKVFKVWKHYPEAPKSLPGHFEWYPADHSNQAELFEALSGAEYIYHCAGKVSFDRRDRKEMWESNVMLTRHIVNYSLANEVKKLAYVSSVAAIGPSGDEPADETKGWPVQKTSDYARSKTQAELEVWRGVTEGLKAVIVNPSVILGPGDWKQSSVKLFDTVYRGMKVYTEGVTGFVDNRDVTEALVQLMNSDINAERFILNSANLSYKELFTQIATAFGKPPPSIRITPFVSGLGWRMAWLFSRLSGKKLNLTRETARSAHRTRRYTAAKIGEALDFRFRAIEDTIRETAGCYLKKNI